MDKRKKKKAVKVEPWNGDDSSIDEMLSKSDESDWKKNYKSNASDEQQLNVMEKLVDVMEHQAKAMTQMAQASLDNSRAMERIAEASNMQALAVERMANTFENVSSSVQDVRNAIMSIDYTMKRCYNNTTDRQNSNLFS